MWGEQMSAFRSVTVFVVASWLTLSGCASLPAANVEAQIRELEQHQARAAMARDRNALERIFAPDFRIVNPAGAVADKQVLLQLLTEGAAPYRSAVYETQTVNVYRDSVVTTGLETVVMGQGARAGESVQRRDHACVATHGRWLGAGAAPRDDRGARALAGGQPRRCRWDSRMSPGWPG